MIERDDLGKEHFDANYESSLYLENSVLLEMRLVTGDQVNLWFILP
jgi:hypothetical protein